jgi:2-hydroxy-3-keto-5-methylthiopentenyl-1-phosphate phosphatase
MYVDLKKYQISKTMIEDICHSPLVKLREGLGNFLTFLLKHRAPVIIYSASCIGYDSIQYVLRQHHLLTPNIKVCSNDIVFDQQGIFKEVVPPIIHSANKVGTTLVKLGYISDPPQTSTCLLIGDSLDDIKMYEGLSFKKRYSVAFANQDQPGFSNVFDQILPLESGFAPIHKLFTDDI